MESEEVSHLSVFGGAMLFSCSVNINWECFHLQASFRCSTNIFFTKEVSYHIVSYRIVLYHIVSYPAKSNFGIYYGQHYFIWEYVLVYIMVDIIPLKIILFVVVVVDVILLWIWALRGSAILVCSLPMKSRKGLARDVFGAFATHASLAYDVTDTLLGSNWSLFAKWFDLTLYLLIIIYFYCKDKNNK